MHIYGVWIFSFEINSHVGKIEISELSAMRRILMSEIYHYHIVDI